MVIIMKEKTVKKKGSLVFVLLVCTILVSVFFLSAIESNPYSYDVKTFSSYEELQDFLKTNFGGNNLYGWSLDDSSQPRSFLAPESSKSGDTSISGNAGGEGSVDYSETNIQVEGVDEPDIVKTDGTYLYVIANQTIFILRAYPAEDAAVLSKIYIEDDVYLSNIFINDNTLIVFGNSHRYPYDYKSPFKEDEKNISIEIIDYEPSYYWWGVSSTIIKIFDISDKENPDIIKDIEIDGSYFDSRMIDNYIYVIATEYSYEIYQEIDEGNVTLNIPEVTINNDTKKIPYDQIYYVDIPQRMDTMTHVIAINLDDNEVKQDSFLLSSSHNIYVSQKNIYLAYTKYNYFIQPRLLLELPSDDNEQSTIVYKISINDGDIFYEGQGEVPGRILNQFSMDEYDGFFRIATTIGFSWGQNEPSSNNVYILNENLKRVSELEDIAPGEQIYSARFIGEKAYLVTFRKIDPFFTLDLSDPYNPEILGSLKIPGYSNYLHPFDENHIIGIGKDTVESDSPNFAWYQGLKIALFDVSDFENPKELDKVIIGDRGTDSPALYDHKAFLFDLEKELLVIPVSLYEISNEIKEIYDENEGSQYGEFTYQGAYVYRLNLDGFEFKGRITHMDDNDMKQEDWYWWWSSSSYIYRSLYIDDVLYTISEKMIKMNNLDDLNEINGVELE